MPALALGAIALQAIDPRVLQLPARPPRRAVLPVRGRVPSARELAQGRGAAGAINPYPIGECTWGVWQTINDRFGVAMPDFVGNATDWLDGARNAGYVTTDKATVNSVVVWSNSKYPPFGHVGFVSDVAGDGSFTVLEMNFRAWNTWDSRVVRTGDDQQGIEGYFFPKGVEAGAASGITTLAARSDPFSELSGGMNQLQDTIQQQVTSLATKTFAGAQIALGMGVLAGGALLTASALKSPAGAREALVSIPGRVGGFTRRTAVPAAQDAVLGPEPAVAGGEPGRITAAGRTRVLAS